MGMHTSHHPSAEVKSKALNFMQFMHQIVLSNNCNRHYILNMDQTPIYFSMIAKRTLELVGGKMVHIRMSSDNMKRVTVAVTIFSRWDGASVDADL